MSGVIENPPPSFLIYLVMSTLFLFETAGLLLTGLETVNGDLRYLLPLILTFVN